MGLSFDEFRPRWPWIGGDLQTLRNRARRWHWPDLAAWPGRRLEFPVDDGSGDVLLAMHHPAAGAKRPLVVLIHGLSGCEDSSYIRYASAFWLGRGWPVLRLNLRGAGPSRSHCRRLYHAGLTGDLRAVLAGLDSAEGVVLIGYSLGANMVLKYLAEEGARANIRAAASVSAPIDLDAASRRIHAARNRVYERWFVANLKATTLAGETLPAAQYAALARVRSVRDYDHAFVAPAHGFADAADYYARSSAAPALADIRVPTMILHAGNDPWIPLDAYRAVDWPACPALTPLLGAPGGHVGFHGAGDPVAWHDRRIGGFFDAVLG